jgi:hypothetical protein
MIEDHSVDIVDDLCFVTELDRFARMIRCFSRRSQRMSMLRMNSSRVCSLWLRWRLLPAPKLASPREQHPARHCRLNALCDRRFRGVDGVNTFCVSGGCFAHFRVVSRAETVVLMLCFLCSSWPPRAYRLVCAGGGSIHRGICPTLCRCKWTLPTLLPIPKLVDRSHRPASCPHQMLAAVRQRRWLCYSGLS